MNVRWDNLLGVEAPWAWLLLSSEADVDRCVREIREMKTGIITKVIQGKRCGTKMQLMEEWASVLHFPDYFGQNWDAFEECITDLEWMPGKGYVFFVTHAESVLTEDEGGLKPFIEILESAAKEWASPDNRSPSRGRAAIPFRVVFHCNPENETTVRERFRIRLPSLVC